MICVRCPGASGEESMGTLSFVTDTTIAYFRMMLFSITAGASTKRDREPEALGPYYPQQAVPFTCQAWSQRTYKVVTMVNHNQNKLFLQARGWWSFYNDECSCWRALSSICQCLTSETFPAVWLRYFWWKTERTGLFFFVDWNWQLKEEKVKSSSHWILRRVSWHAQI